MNTRRAFCTEKTQDGHAVEHEMDDGELLLFCKMDHFKRWVAERRERELSVK